MGHDINKSPAAIMHIDLNSAFATTEQQAHPSLRGKPLGVTNRLSKHCCVIAASYEAKARGVKVGMRLDEAQALIPGFIMLEADPQKYHHVYQVLARIMKSYSPIVQMKSIDEGIIDFRGTESYHGHRSLERIGYDIKKRVREEIGSWMRINVGIGPNRFLAKQAASWHKPDGLDTIDWRNLHAYYRSIQLTDLTGIASHFEARLQSAGIYTPIDFLKATADTLRRTVFRSVIGEDWHQRLRGHEVDDQPTKLGSVGRQFVLDVRSDDDETILPRFQYLCETTGKKLRYNGCDARGIVVWATFQTGDSWQQRKMFKTTFYTDRDIYQRALYLFNQRPRHLIIVSMGITCCKLSPTARQQSSLFASINRQEWLAEAVDTINERYGSFMISSAQAFVGKHAVQQKIPFGGTKYFELLLGRSDHSIDD
ncbi:DNA polymerase IV [soil metagenome]